MTLIITLYIGKYFDNDGVENVASFVKFIFFVMSHHFIDKLMHFFKVNEVNNPLCLPDIKKDKLISHILSKPEVEKSIYYSIEIAKGENKKKTGTKKKVPQEFESIKIMTQSEIYWSQLSIIRRLFISWMEFILASANTYGSQSDFVQLFMQIFSGQLIFRFYEMLEVFNLPIFHV